MAKHGQDMLVCPGVIDADSISFSIADNLVVKFYDKHFREAGWKKVTSQTVMGRYIGGWEKDGWSIDMTCSKDESGGSFTSLVYYE